MATKEDVYEALDLFFSHRHRKGIEDVSKHKVGAMAVLMYLSEKGEAKSIDISKSLKLSTARMTVLLKKLESKELIIKTHSKVDARAVTIKLSEKGLDISQNIKSEMFNAMEKVLDEMGIDEIKKLVEGLNKVSEILYQNRPTQMEELNV